MAGHGDHLEDNELSDYLSRLGYDVGSLRFQMRNNFDCIMSETLFTQPTASNSKTADSLHSHLEDDKPENLKSEYFHHSVSDGILTNAINQCKDPAEHTCLLSEYLKELREIEAELNKKLDEMCHRYEESFSQIIHSCNL